MLIVLAYIIGDSWYVVYYGHNGDIMKAGQWLWAFNYSLEVKEHLFFIMPLFGIYLEMLLSWKRKSNVSASDFVRS